MPPSRTLLVAPYPCTQFFGPPGVPQSVEHPCLLWCQRPVSMTERGSPRQEAARYFLRCLYIRDQCQQQVPSFPSQRCRGPQAGAPSAMLGFLIQQRATHRDVLTWFRIASFAGLLPSVPRVGFRVQLEPPSFARRIGPPSPTPIVAGADLCSAQGLPALLGPRLSQLDCSCLQLERTRVFTCERYLTPPVICGHCAELVPIDNLVFCYCVVLGEFVLPGNVARVCSFRSSRLVNMFR